MLFENSKESVFYVKTKMHKYKLFLRKEFYTASF